MATSQLKPRLYGAGHIKRLKKRAAEDKITKQEYVELLLSYAIKGRDVKPQARELFLKSKGNLRKVFEVVAGEKIRGIGPEAVFLFSFLKNFIAEYEKEKFIKREYRAGCQQDVLDYFRTICGQEQKESVHAMYLDAKNRIIDCHRISEGTLTQSVLYPREIIRKAIDLGSLGIILVHNHPSGDPSPSENDRKITRKLAFAAKEMDLNVLDHIVIGGGDYYSFYEQGLIAGYNSEYTGMAAIKEK